VEVRESQVSNRFIVTIELGGTMIRTAYVAPELVSHGNVIRRTLGSGQTSLEAGTGFKTLNETAPGSEGSTEGTTTGQHDNG